MKTKALVLLCVLLLAEACSSGNDSRDEGGVSTISETVTIIAVPVATASGTAVPEPSRESQSEEVSVVVPFKAGNGAGTVEVSGEGSTVAVWFANLPGEVSLDLADADATDDVSVVEGLVSFWFSRDDASGDVPPSVFVSAGGEISDSLGTRYVVEAERLPAAPRTEAADGADAGATGSSTAAASSTTTSSAATSTTAASVPTVDPETSEDPETSATSEPPDATTTTTTASPPPTSTATTAAPPAALRVQVLNGSGVAGAAGRMTARLSEAGFVVLPPGNAPQRYASSAVYYADGWQDEAEEILETAGIDEIEEVTAMPAVFASEDAAVVVLLGRDTAPAIAREQAGLRPRPAARYDGDLPLPASVPRDRFVPGLAYESLYTEQNENNPASAGQLADLAAFMGRVGYCHPYFGGQPQLCQGEITLTNAYQAIEELLGELGFTPQNVCGAPAGYSFTDLLKPTREWSETFKNYSGDAIFTTDRLIELHGGERINPEENLDFYIREAVQTAYDALRLSELLDETEAPQLILCRAFLAPSGEVPEFASGAWYALLTPGIQPRESLLSQGTYHFKEISRNGNKAWIWICHPTLGARGIGLHWREAGYRAEVHGDFDLSGCQAAYEAGGYTSDVADEDVIKFSFGERAFSGSDLSNFPRN